ncbi:HIT family protein 1 [Fomitiporia mediterranea MF3/22]|uniref:HIT family protein 1 n=1 Tax=Fomitiporia mediterranea (strain MF3/22) TaxID=694068 RepID=UPI000440864B|nr:HIT family protein 1 [Fomitiporia mediterranea MF3/22]EJC98407.1 HIT family protein 1 [Fomitiporia mediterranea MF3/22]
MAAVARSLASCLFCKIIKGEIPSFKLIETDLSFSFLDIGPLSRGHALVIPKDHGEKLTDVDDAFLADTLLVSKRIAGALGCDNYNILQNNGELAHQVVKHVHFHVIPKPNAEQGLVIGWPTQEANMDELKVLHEELSAKLRVGEGN